jgi:arylsulfatase
MSATERPNILFVIADQWRGDCLSITGHPAVETPNLDMLARRGVVFTSAYSSCPSCIAARASMFTGLAPTSHGRLGYQDRVPWRYEHMLPEVLGNAGYQTYCIGKTHFYPQRSHCGFQGLESYEALQNLDGRYVNDYAEWLRERIGGTGDENVHGLSHNGWPARPSHLPEELHNNSWVAERAIEFMKRRDPTRPFFLNLSFHRPHPPIDPPKVYWDMYKDRSLPPVPIGDWAAEIDDPVDSVDAFRGRFDPDHIDRARRGYYAQIAHIDNQIGRVLNAAPRLQAGPLAVVFTSDHGEMLGDHNLFRKTFAYEGSARIPLIVSLPEKAERDSCFDSTPAVLEDVYPTILDIAGVESPGTPDRIDGLSLMPLYGAGSDDTDSGTGSDAIGERAYVHGEHSACYDAENAMQFLTDGQEKFIWNPVTGAEQLFDLRTDPNECRELSCDPNYADRRSHWRQRLVEKLEPRQEDGLSDGKHLIPGASPPAVRRGLPVADFSKK